MEVVTAKQIASDVQAARFRLDKMLPVCELLKTEILPNIPVGKPRELCQSLICNIAILIEDDKKVLLQTYKFERKEE